ncbi:cell envelope integrity protein TolA [Sulfitobacter sp. CS16]|uniref:cell envelope integrity protein TolA n=1 Tax=Sulfitobacter sp. CS16 TaxID=3368573 RepID=UPI0037453245
MKQAFDFLAFAAIAALVHLVLFREAPNGAAPTSGIAGENSITLAASSEALSALVAEWDRPVEAFHQVSDFEPLMPTAIQQPPPVQRAQPNPKMRTARPPVASVALDLEDLPAIDSSVPQLSVLAVKTSPRPEKRPVRINKPRSSSSTTAKAALRQTAAGSGRKQASGNAGVATDPPQRQSLNPALMAQWGNSIRSSVERRKRYPAGTRNRGTVTLSIAVSMTGTLSSVAVQSSSGDARPDQAALAAVGRASFKAAPKGLSSAVHRFSLPIKFEG